MKEEEIKKERIVPYKHFYLNYDGNDEGWDIVREIDNVTYHIADDLEWYQASDFFKGLIEANLVDNSVKLRRIYEYCGFDGFYIQARYNQEKDEYDFYLDYSEWGDTLPTQKDLDDEDPYVTYEEL